MAEKTDIAWTESTWNPWQGCAKVSPGCKFCYMFRDKKRYGQDPEKVVRSAPRTFNMPLRLKDPQIIFTCSWSDWFIREADAWRAEAWAIIRKTPHLKYLILTKRPERIAECLPPDWGKGYENVALGVTVENQEMADLRIPILLGVPAALWFVSAEPLLGALDLQTPDDRVKQADGSLRSRKYLRGVAGDQRIGWVIVGGESGGEYRPMDLAWARDIRKQCAEAGVSFFFKQTGGPRGGDDLLDGERVQEFPACLSRSAA